jgi:hypothetical protein
MPTRADGDNQMGRKLACAAFLIGFVAVGGCAATHKPPVDFSQPGVTQEKHDADLADCRAQASSLSLSRQQAGAGRSFGTAGSASSNPAITYYRDDPNAGLLMQPGGVQKFLDLCMQRKGYQLTD